MRSCVTDAAPDRRSRYDEHLAGFADIGDFIEAPGQDVFLSGMQVRLAFAVMAHVDAGILVIDEALAVGDALVHAEMHALPTGVQAARNAAPSSPTTRPQ